MVDLAPLHSGWSTRAGRTLPADPRPIEATEIADRILIAERIARYGWCIDERRLDAMMANFTETVLWDGSVMGVDQVGPFHGQQEVREFLAGILETQTAQRRHSFTNVVVDRLDGDEATAHAYLLLWSSEQGRTTPITTGPYRFTFTRMGGEWLISAVLAGWDAPLDWQR